MIELIDYLIENGACDCCARCIHNKSISESGNVEPCAEFGKDGNGAVMVTRQLKAACGGK